MWCLVTDDGRRIPLPRLPATLGAGPGADVVVEGPELAERHARLSEGPDGDLLLDALDDAPVEVGGWLVGRAGLRAGDEVAIGGARFTVLRQAEDGASRPGAAVPGAARRPSAAGAARRARAPGSRRSAGASAGSRTTGGGAARTAAGARPESRPPSTRPRLDPPRGGAPRVGLLGSDMSQISGGLKVLLVVALLAAAGGLVWLAQLLVREL